MFLRFAFAAIAAFSCIFSVPLLAAESDTQVATQTAAESAPSTTSAPQPMAAAAGGEEGGEEEGRPSDDVLSRMNRSSDITAESTDLFGDQIDLASGAFSLAQTDAALPGNLLDLSISRSFKGRLYTYRKQLAFGDWELNVPYIHTTLLDNGLRKSGSWGINKECSGSLNPGPITFLRAAVEAHEYWDGDSINVPGKGREILMDNGDATYRRVTKSHWRISCASRSPAGEKFIAQTPDGLRIMFDKLVYAEGVPIERNFKVISRLHAYMMASRVEDRFGNWINYNYSTTSDSLTPWRLTSITASDGRSITFNYQYSQFPKAISSIVVGGKAWTYVYAANSYGDPILREVVRPDNKRWLINIDTLSTAPKPEHEASEGGAPVTGDCVGWQYRSGGFGTITHPNGMTATFQLNQTVHGRSEVPKFPNSNGSFYYYPKCFSTLSLTTKTLSAPNVPTLTWNYQYSENVGAFAGEPKTAVSGVTVNGYDAGDLKTTTMTAPDGSKTRHIFSRRWDFTDGKEVATDYFDNDGVTKLRRVERTFKHGGFNGADTDLEMENLQPHVVRVQLDKQIQTDYAASGSTTFTTEYSNYNAYDVPLNVKECNSIAGSTARYTRQTYQHTNLWLLNTPTKTELSSDGVNYTTVNETVYHPACVFGKLDCGSSAQVQHDKRFGNIVKTYSYDNDGNVKRITFAGNTNRWQEFANYYRGKAQLITMPHRTISGNTVTASLTVSADGTITRTTDFNGNITDYQYDGLSRLTLINPADPKWADTTISYVDAVDGSPQQTITRGNYQKITTFDALLRPLLVSEEDISDVNTKRYTRSLFNAYNKPTFQSFAASSATETQGRTFSYDGLQRAKTDCSTVDNRCTTIEYLANNQLKVTNPRGFATTTSFQAFGAPTHDKPLVINSPESITTTLTYNLFGNVSSITQGGVTETRLYDANQYLCKTIRPETNHTLFNNNVLGEVLWSVEGVTGSTTACETSTSATNKVSNTYDNWGEVVSQDYADTTPDVLYTRDAQGNVLTVRTGTLSSGTIASAQTLWTYSYNSVNAIETETLNVDGLSFGLNPEYNSLAHINSLTYPSGSTIAYSPNALGQAKQAGSYASDARYHPNGVMNSFTYGNQLTYLQTLDAERRPYQLSAAGSTVKFTYAYDANNNVTSLIDHFDNSYSLSGFVYDGLDRLKNVNGKWGVGAFTYDAISNIKTQSLGTTNYSYTYSSTTNRLSGISGSASKSFGSDGRGNITQNGTQTLTFNAANEMVSGNGATYLYDANHRLVKKTLSGTTTYSVYSSSGTLITQYQSGVYTDFIKLGTQTVAEVKAGTPTYQHSDVLGSPIAESSQTQSITRYHYKPFGERFESFAKDDTGYTGHQFDTALGLTYAQARYYDQTHPRFMSIDPVGYTLKNPVMSFNRYAYANNNPYKYVDPDGREVNIAIRRITYTKNSVVSIVTVTSTNTSSRFSGYALEDSIGGTKRDKNPIAPGSYSAFVRTRDTGVQVIQLENVPDYTAVQMHSGNTAKDVEGCFAAGETTTTDRVDKSKSAMQEILDTIEEDGSGIINVEVTGSSTDPALTTDTEEQEIEIF